MYKLLIFLLLPLTLCASSQEACRELQALLLVKDFSGAAQAAREAQIHHPHSMKVQQLAIHCLAAAGDEEEMMAAWEAFASRYPDEGYSQELLEAMCWGILRKGRKAMGTNTQLIDTIGAGLTRDMYAVEFLQEGMQHSNAVIRELSVQIAAEYGDIPLKAEISRLFKEEKVESVRCTAIRAVGKLRIEALHHDLVKIVGNEKVSSKEKLAAIEALVAWRENVSAAELQRLANHRRAGLRRLACEVIAHLDLRQERAILQALVRDTNPQVRASAIHALGLLRLPLPKVVSTLALKDAHPDVGIVASWATLLEGDERGARRWLEHGNARVRAKMAAAVAASGPYGVELAKEELDRSTDPFVRVNLVLGLLGQREQCDEGCALLAAFLQAQSGKLMLTKEEIFDTLLPSDVTHNPAIANYPDVVDQTVRLELLNLLAIMRYPGALDAMKSFLTRGNRGVTGLAAEGLLGEGDESALELVRTLLKDPDKRIRLEAALVLATWGRDPEALPTLLAVYPECDRQLKIKILESLARIGDKKAVPFLVERLSESSQTMRLIASSILIQTLNR